jgi:hypothetical protein
VKQGLVAAAPLPLGWPASQAAPPMARPVGDGSEFYFSSRDRGGRPRVGRVHIARDLRRARRTTKNNWTRGATVPLYFNGTDSGEVGIGYAVAGP